MDDLLRMRSKSRISFGIPPGKSSMVSLKNQYIRGIIHASTHQNGAQIQSQYKPINVQSSPYSKKMPRKSLGDMRNPNKQFKQFEQRESRSKLLSRGSTIARTRSKQYNSHRQRFEQPIANKVTGTFLSGKSISLRVSGKKVKATQQLNRIKQQLQIIVMIGKGGFGKVWKVFDAKMGRHYALKEISKATVLTKKSMESIINERNLLSVVNSNFIVSMIKAFQQQQYLYILMELMDGGDLRYHICKSPQFKQIQIRFIIACIVQALTYLHANGIIHRDVKPENIVFDQRGYAMLTDLGIANNCTSGTPGYMAPEVIFNKGHSFESDFYALGVITYQLMNKRRPYRGKNRAEVKQQIKMKQAIIPKKEIPHGFSIQIADFVNKTLQREPLLRLGWGGIRQIKNHPWLRDFPWKLLQSKSIQSPFQRPYEPTEVRYRPTQHNTDYLRQYKQNQNQLASGKYKSHFYGYTFDQDTIKNGQNNITIKTQIK